MILTCHHLSIIAIMTSDPPDSPHHCAVTALSLSFPQKAKVKQYLLFVNFHSPKFQGTRLISYNLIQHLPSKPPMVCILKKVGNPNSPLN